MIFFFVIGCFIVFVLRFIYLRWYVYELVYGIIVFVIVRFFLGNFVFVCFSFFFNLVEYKVLELNFRFVFMGMN